MSVSLGELAVRFGCELRGDPGVRVEHVASLATAGPAALAFLANPKYRPQLAATRAGAVVLGAADAADVSCAVLVAANPYAAYARMAALLHPVPVSPPGIHPTAWVAPLARVAGSAHVGPHAAIEAGTCVGERAVIGPGCVIEADVEIAEDVRLVARVIVCRGSRIGPRTIVQPGAVIGGDGFGFAPELGAWVKVPQVGRVVVGADVEIGANTTIDRGAIGDTVIEDGVKLDNQIQIGHNVRIGAHSALAACVGVSGSTTIGKRCQIGGAVGIVGHLSICDDVAVTGLSMVSHSISQPGVYSSGLPAIPAPEWRRAVARLHRLDRMAGQVAELGKKLDRK
ncbi:MAG: UDP-3-O-(3-hydroxymyristoyl)glucosamine N-acyltransferase [Steroidobacteraceae bacterium]